MSVLIWFGPLDIPRSYLSRGFGRFVGEKVGELFGEAIGGATL